MKPIISIILNVSFKNIQAIIADVGIKKNKETVLLAEFF